MCSSIVSISQPYIRPIVRGKAKMPVEFGTKLDMSIDERGIARLERLSFDAYNEADVLIEAFENYRNRKKLAFCKSKNNRISGTPLGR